MGDFYKDITQPMRTTPPTDSIFTVQVDSEMKLLLVSAEGTINSYKTTTYVMVPSLLIRNPCLVQNILDASHSIVAYLIDDSLIIFHRFVRDRLCPLITNFISGQ